ncbi:hypothetical protein, partial [Paraburkholderia silviterrae]|uniref:hypothetical protein n=1 Tax=Paraburkholderia silviterrae TaxID=2528715 RepID=UPI00196B7F44
TLSNLENATAGIVSGATGGYTLTDAVESNLGTLTVAHAELAKGATNFVSNDYTYGLSDTLQHLEGAAPGLLLGATGGYTLTDDANSYLGALTVANAELAKGASNFGPNAYTYELSDTLLHLEGAANGIILGAMGGYTLTDDANSDLGTLTVANAELATGASNFGSNHYTYELSDTLSNLENATAGIVSGSTGGYTLTDAVESNFGTLTVANAELAKGASNFGSNGYTYELSDTLANLEGATTGIISGATGGYMLTDAAERSLGTLTVAQAELAKGATNFVSNDYAYALDDTLQHLEGAATGIVSGSS